MFPPGLSGQMISICSNWTTGLTEMAILLRAFPPISPSNYSLCLAKTGSWISAIKAAWIDIYGAWYPCGFTVLNYSGKSSMVQDCYVYLTVSRSASSTCIEIDLLLDESNALVLLYSYTTYNSWLNHQFVKWNEFFLLCCLGLTASWILTICLAIAATWRFICIITCN